MVTGRLKRLAWYTLVSIVVLGVAGCGFLIVISRGLAS
jgi:hypothetical protein